jgi:pimeloyl-ACP methyl ester carboxylesterase
MGGGEVARYMSRHHGYKVARVVLIGSVTPMLLKGPDNKDGVGRDVFAKMYDDVQHDRFAFLSGFGKLFFGESKGKRGVSKDTMHWGQMMAMMASPIATMRCIESFSMTDFRQDMAEIHVPTLIIHGKADKVVPWEASSRWASAMLPSAECKVYDDGPHALFVTHKDQLNSDLITFLRKTESDMLAQPQTMRSTAMPQNTARH